MTSSVSTTPVSVASNTSAGAAGGSVINVQALVQQVVTATQAPQQKLIASQTSSVTAQISALGTLKSALSTFQSALSSLDTPSAFNAESATSSNTAAFKATASSGAPVGTYSVTVGNLASAQQILSNPFTSGTGTGTQTVGTGSLKLSLGASSFNLNITSSNDTLAGIASAINTATDNPGITATIIQGTDGAHLLLSSSQTGAANTIQVEETDGGTELAALTYGTGNTGNFSEQAQALDAQYSISGVASTSPSNTVTDAVNGVTLTLTGKTAAGTAETLTVSTNTTTIETNISAFVSAYNTLVGQFSSLGGYDSATGNAGPMMGNALLSTIQNGIRTALYSVVNTGSSSYNSLATVGITSNKDGTISLDQAKLSQALATNFTAVSELFSSSGGVATTLNDRLNTTLGSSGVIASNSKSLTNQSNALTKKSNELQDQMSALSDSLTLQYSRLNTLLSSLQSMSSYLTQVFATLPSLKNNNG